MRMLLAACALIALAGPAAAQQDTTRRDSTHAAPRGEHLTGPLPYEVAAELAALFNEPAALRASGRLDIPERQIVTGDVAVLNGPLTVAGTVAGRVVVINGDVVLGSNSRIDGDLYVVGGVIQGQPAQHVGGSVHRYRQVLHYARDGEVIAAVPESDERVEDTWYRRFRRHREESDSRLDLWAGTYNRVEGLPVVFGPSIRRQADWGTLRLAAHGIIRSADNFEWKEENLGYDLTGQVQLGPVGTVTLGGEAYDRVDPVEDWHLRDSEVGLASFFLHQDYRDYFERHGGGGSVTLANGQAARLRLGYARERWSSRRDRDPFTLFRNAHDWRPNPMLDDGLFHILDAALTLDTRNDIDTPWSGWLVSAELEHGSGKDVRNGPSSPLARASGLVPQSVAYTRGLLDIRRYNRVSPKAQLNFRLVVGGWLGGDELPLERRFSIGGPGTLPGYDFRRAPGSPDVLQCSNGAPLPGNPAQCERVALAQVEYRGDLHLGLHSNGDIQDWHYAFDRPGSWVIFMDAGRGWLVGEPEPGIRYRAGAVPPLGSFRSDVGAGLDFGLIGLFIAKSTSSPIEPLNFFVRLQHRF